MATAVDQEQTLKALKNKRRSIKSALTRALTFVTNFDPRENAISLLEFRQEELPSLNRAFDDIQSQIELADPNNVEEADAEREAFEQKYFMVRSQMQEIIKLEKSQNTSLHNCSSSSVIPIQRARLAPIALPQFDGNILEWESFFDLFRSLVHEDDSLPSSQKFSHLRSCLSGQALDIIKALPLTETNYNVAINRLKKRYGNKSLIIQSHIRSILDAPCVKGTAPGELQNLHSCITTHVSALEALGQPIEYWDAWLVTIILSKLDQVTVQEWQVTRKDTELPLYTDLECFLINRCVALESSNAWTVSSDVGKVKSSKDVYSTRKNKSNASVLSIQQGKCVLCSEFHMIYHCPKFKGMQVCERYNTVKQNRLCFNCLSSSHGVRDCKAQSCKHCKFKHNSLLHGLPSPSHRSQTSENEKEIEQSVPDTPSGTNNDIAALHSTCVTNQVLLSTAVVLVQDCYGRKHPCRVLLDNGSQINILTQELAKRLGLNITRSSLPICGVNGANTRSSQCVELSFFSTYLQYEKVIECHVLPSITIPLPVQSINIAAWSFPDNVKDALADPRFNVSSTIDMLLGADIFYELIRTPPMVMPGGSPWLYETSLGWIISGPVPTVQQRAATASVISALLMTSEWMESKTLKRSKHQDEMACERSFQETHRQQADGRFVVRLPFRLDPSVLGRSMEIALSRFLSLERRLQREPDLHKEYCAFMDEYESLGHMSSIKDPVLQQGNYYYIPHHAVFKASSSTTKLRVVFDASMKTSMNTSLNDVLMLGPVLQQDLFDIVLRFRLHIYVITADVAKMYRQVLVDESDRQFQRILWRDSPDKPLQHFVLNTITYGTVSASFLATRVLKELAIQCANQLPEISQAISRDFYMDDFLSGADSIEEAKSLYAGVSKVLESGCMPLRKWCSNSQQLRTMFNSFSNEPHYSLDLEQDGITSSLGLAWCPKEDELKFLNKSLVSRKFRSKRELLSALNSVFDPLGFISPVLIRGKIFLQELWQLKLTWDAPLPGNISTRWTKFIEDLQHCEQLAIPRSVKQVIPSRVEFHAFCDASQSAYAACIYYRHQDSDGSWHIQLLCSKTRVAPLKVLSIPRLELSGAHLLSELVQKVSLSLGISASVFICWTDSMVALSWIRGSSCTWKTFIANRVSQIQDVLSPSQWRYVNTENNPADVASRGTNARDLINHDLWWTGPKYLLLEEVFWPQENQHSITIPEEVLERKKVHFTLLTANPTIEVVERYSDWNRMCRITAYLLRFFQNTQAKQEFRKTSHLTVSELTLAERTILRRIQTIAFQQEYTALSKGNPVSSNSKLKSLSPFIDQGLIKVGGRLHNASISESQKHPILLPANHKVTVLIFKATHQKLLHIGPQGLLANIRLHYWPLNGRNLARSTVHRCITCFRLKPTAMQPVMGNLPASRVTCSRPFQKCGVDFCGPLYVRNGLRKINLTKAYIAVFVCFSVKAVHLELVSSLSADAFLAALRRFMARRGLCSDIYSDNGTNFVGANKELRLFYKNSANGRTIPAIMADEKINWHFIPPGSPNFGGLWEASVKSAKHHLIRTMKSAHLSFEELSTVLIQIEACLNSRPLIPMSNDPNDLSTLTPAHFLIGGPMLSPPEPNYTDCQVNRLKRWQLVQSLHQGFWRRWSKEYLAELQIRKKWTKQSINVKKGMLGILHDPNSTPLKWMLVRVTDTHPGIDGVVRVISLRTSSGNFIKRPASRFSPLPTIDNKESEELRPSPGENVVA